MEGLLGYTGYVYVDTLTGKIIHGVKGQTIYDSAGAVKRSMAHSSELSRLVIDEWLKRMGCGQLLLDIKAAKVGYDAVIHLKYDDPVRDIAQRKYFDLVAIKNKELRKFSHTDNKKLRKELTGKGGRCKVMQVDLLMLKDPEEE